MKKIVALLLTFVLMFTCVSAFAADIAVNVNGEAVDFDVQPENTDVAVFIPLRFVLEKMGATISWHGETKTVFVDFGGKVSTLQIGTELIFLEEGSIELSAVPVLKEGRTLVPMDVINFATGAAVEYNAEMSVVNITSAAE